MNHDGELIEYPGDDDDAETENSPQRPDGTFARFVVYPDDFTFTEHDTNTGEVLGSGGIPDMQPGEDGYAELVQEFALAGIDVE